MRVFISAKWEERAYARKVMDQFEAAGHTVTHDWTKEDPLERTGESLRKYLGQCALDDRKGVKTAEAQVIIAHPQGKGMFTEHGIAIAHDIPVVVVKRELAENVFYDLPNHWHVDTVEAALDTVNQLAARNARSPLDEKITGALEAA